MNGLRILAAAAAADSAERPDTADEPPLRYDEFLQRCLGKPDIAARVLETFRRQARGDVEALLAAVAGQEARKVRELAHRLKGAAANLAASRLRTLAARLEEDALHGRLAEAPQLAADLEREYRTLAAFVAQLPVSIPAA